MREVVIEDGGIGEDGEGVECTGSIVEGREYGGGADEDEGAECEGGTCEGIECESGTGDGVKCGWGIGEYVECEGRGRDDGEARESVGDSTSEEGM